MKDTVTNFNGINIFSLFYYKLKAWFEDSQLCALILISLYPDITWYPLNLHNFFHFLIEIISECPISLSGLTGPEIICLLVLTVCHSLKITLVHYIDILETLFDNFHFLFKISRERLVSSLEFILSKKFILA